MNERFDSIAKQLSSSERIHFFLVVSRAFNPGILTFRRRVEHKFHASPAIHGVIKACLLKGTLESSLEPCSVIPVIVVIKNIAMLIREREQGTVTPAMAKETTDTWPSKVSSWSVR